MESHRLFLPKKVGHCGKQSQRWGSHKQNQPFQNCKTFAKSVRNGQKAVVVRSTQIFTSVQFSFPNNRRGNANSGASMLNRVFRLWYVFFCKRFGKATSFNGKNLAKIACKKREKKAKKPCKNISKKILKKLFFVGYFV